MKCIYIYIYVLLFCEGNAPKRCSIEVKKFIYKLRYVFFEKELFEKQAKIVFSLNYFSNDNHSCRSFAMLLHFKKFLFPP